jgi:hypothetical protein
LDAKFPDHDLVGERLKQVYKMLDAWRMAEDRNRPIPETQLNARIHLIDHPNPLPISWRLARSGDLGNLAIAIDYYPNHAGNGSSVSAGCLAFEDYYISGIPVVLDPWLATSYFRKAGIYLIAYRIQQLLVHRGTLAQAAADEGRHIEVDVGRDHFYR